MNSLTPLLNIKNSQPKVAIFMSGSGSNAEKILSKLKSTINAPFQVVALVTDAPERSRAKKIAQTFNLNLIEHDIRKFYHNAGAKNISIATERGREIREDWTAALRLQLKPLKIDFAIFAGFIPLTNITEDYPCLNVHPGDLTYLKNNQRYLVGLHTVPIDRAILEDIGYMRSSVILAEPYSGKGDDMDSGLILGISAMVNVDTAKNEVSDLQEIYDNRPAKRPKGGFSDQLQEVADANLEALKIAGDWTVFPKVVFDFAQGKYSKDENNKLYYKIGKKFHPIETVIFYQDKTEPIFINQ